MGRIVAGIKTLCNTLLKVLLQLLCAYFAESVAN